MTEPKIEIAAIWPPSNASVEAAKAVTDVLAPMLEDYWAEVRSDDSWEFNPDIETFITAWQARVFVPVVLKVDGVPSGFALVSVAPMLFSKAHKDAEIMSLYIKPEFRGRGLVAKGKEYILQIAQALGVSRVMSVPPTAHIVHYKG